MESAFHYEFGNGVRSGANTDEPGSLGRIPWGTTVKPVFVEQLDASAQSAIVSYFMVSEAETKKDKNGKAYACLTFQDRTGTIPVRIWDCDTKFTVGDILKVEATPSVYRDELQLTVERWRKAEDAEIEIEDFIPASKRDRDEMLEKVFQNIDRIKHIPLRDLVRVIVEDNKVLLRNAPAAKGMHQAYLGGLLEHILNLCELADGVCNFYPTLNRDLLIASSILHDIGKIHELKFSRVIEYSSLGSLIGHLSMALQMIALYDNAVTRRQDDCMLEQLQHIIASHHGRREWGAVQEPMTREANVFHQLDMIDSRMAFFDALTETGFIWHKGERVYVPEKELEQGA